MTLIRMYRFAWILFVIAFGTAFGVADDDAIKKQAREQADLYNQAILDRNFEKAADFSRPEVLRKIGGRKALIKNFKSAVDQLDADGAKMAAITVEGVGNPISTKSNLYVIVTHSVEVTVGSETVTLKSYLLGTQNKRSQKWSFLSGSVGKKELRKIDPEIPAKLSFPEPQEPVLKEDSKN